MSDRTMAVVTGATGGIGRQVCFALFRHFDVVAVGFRSNVRMADGVCAAIGKHGGEALAQPLDVRSSAAVEAAAEALAAQADIRAVVHCAGVESGLPGTDLVELTVAEVDETIDVDLKGTVYVAQHFGSRMAAPGSLVLISSLAGVRPLPDNLHYVAAKAGVEGLVQGLAARLAPSVRVNAVAPGVVAVGGVTGLSAADEQAVVQASALRQTVDARSVARVVKLLTVDPPPITGQSILVDAGLSLPRPLTRTEDI